jgi:hypothetical protein
LNLIFWCNSPVRSRGRVGRSSRDFVSGGGIRGCGFVLGVPGLSYVLDISNIAVAIRLVSNDLSAAVGKDDPVRSGGHFSIAALGMGIVVVGFDIFNSPFEAVRLCGLYANRNRNWRGNIESTNCKHT